MEGITLVTVGRMGSRALSALGTVAKQINSPQGKTVFILLMSADTLPGATVPSPHLRQQLHEALPSAPRAAFCSCNCSK